MAANRTGGTGGADETTGTGARAGGDTSAAAGGAGAGAGAAGGTGASRGGRRGGATGEGGKAAATTRSRSRKGAETKAADTQGGEGGAKRGTAKKAGGRGTGGAAKGTQAKGPDLRADLREFASSRLGGWSHHDWMGLLDDLRGRGHDVSDTDQVGRQLEQERLSLRLEQIEGLGPRHVRALSERFRTLYSLRQASVDEIAQVPNVSRQTAERVHEQLR